MPAWLGSLCALVVAAFALLALRGSLERAAVEPALLGRLRWVAPLAGTVLAAACLCISYPFDSGHRIVGFPLPVAVVPERAHSLADHVQAGPFLVLNLALGFLLPYGLAAAYARRR